MVYLLFSFWFEKAVVNCSSRQRESNAYEETDSPTATAGKEEKKIEKEPYADEPIQVWSISRFPLLFLVISGKNSDC